MVTSGEFVYNIRGKPSHLLAGIFSLFLSSKIIKNISYSYVPLQKVRFLCRFGLKTGIVFAHFGLESGMVFEGTTGVYERKSHNGMALDER